MPASMALALCLCPMPVSPHATSSIPACKTYRDPSCNAAVMRICAQVCGHQVSGTADAPPLCGVVQPQGRRAAPVQLRGVSSAKELLLVRVRGQSSAYMRPSFVWPSRSCVFPTLNGGLSHRLKAFTSKLHGSDQHAGLRTAGAQLRTHAASFRCHNSGC